MYKVVMPDGQETVPVDMQTLAQWAAEGRVHAETTIVDTDSGYRFRAADHPYLQSRVAALPVLTGSHYQAAELPEEPLNPWISMLTKPRQTIRQIIVTNPEQGVILLALLSGLASIDAERIQRMGRELPVGIVVALYVVFAPLLSLLGLYIGGALMRWTGSWLGGTAESREVRAALAWGNVPMIYVIPAVLAQVALIVARPNALEDASLSVVFLILGVIEFAAAIWGMIVMSKALGEVHGFSAWRGFSTMLLGILIVVAPIIVIVMFIAALAVGMR
jgi:hypothetical protein